MKLGDNLKLLRKRSKKSQEEMASILSLTRSSYSGYENGVAEPGIDTLLQLSDYYKIPLDFIVRKDFSLFTETDWNRLEEGLQVDVTGKNLRVLTSLVDADDNELIEMIPEKARAGYTTGYADPDYLSILPTFSLPFLSKNKKYRSFPIQGDSMPPVVEGSYVVGEFIQNWMTVKDGTPCVLVTENEGIVFKIVYNNLMKDQTFQLCSTNPLYEPYAVKANEVLEIWKFVNYISPELPEVKPDEEKLSKSIMALQKEVQSLKQAFEKKEVN